MPPGFQKQIVDIPAADGLAQKIDPRRLPMGKAASAVNLVKNKLGRLEKRLGFNPLTKKDNPFQFPMPLTDGVAATTWNDNLCVIGRGVWNPSAGISANLTVLKTYSDDEAAWTNRGLVPEMPVVEDDLLADAPTSAFSVTSVIAGDFKVIAWIGLDLATNGQVYYCVKEISTGLYVQPPQQADTTNGNLTYVRLALIGSTLILAYSSGATIWVKNMPTSQLVANTFNLFQAATVLTNANSSLNGAFDLVEISGDNANFVLAFCSAHLISAVKIQANNFAVFSGTTIVNATTTAFGTPSSTGAAYGIRADATQGIFVTYWITGSVNSLYCALVNPACTAVTIANTLVYSVTTNATENMSYALAAAYCGGLTAGANPTWMIGWTPNGSSPNYGGPVAASLLPQNNSRILTQQMFSSGGAFTKVTGPPRSTPGLHLVSNFLEANGIIYALGWIPSAFQGGYIVMAFDYSNNTVDALTQIDSGGFKTPWLARPIANLQTRTALAVSGIIGASGIQGVTYQTSGINTAINTQSGLAKWNFQGDVYQAVHVCYVGTTQGNKTMPATGALQTKARSGYPSTQFGTMLAVGGGLPFTFDGVDIFEQNFLYCPEQVAVGPMNTGAMSGPTWTSANGVVNWIFTYEQFDIQGNFSISARSPPVSIYGADTIPSSGRLNVAWAGGTTTANPVFSIPTLGPTLRYFPTPTTLAPTSFIQPPTTPVTIGVYRTIENGLVYFRVADRYFDGRDPAFLGPINDPNKTVVTYQDIVPYQAAGTSINDGTHPLLYGDGTNGAPGSLDNFCPPATPVMVRHKERVFVARDNLVMYTKARAEFVGPGYNEQVDAFFVGNDDPITGLDSMDDKLVIMKRKQIYYIGGDGPADDGTGSSFTQPQPVPTDSGCIDPRGIRSTPEGTYYMSDAGLRLLTRSLGIEYVGGPVEDELGKFPVVTASLLYPENNRVVFLVNQNDYSTTLNGEFIWRDYVLDAWTSATGNPVTWTGFISGTVATVLGVTRVVHFLTQDGTIWRENTPTSTRAYMDNGVYVPWIWTSPFIKLSGDQGRFRVWDIISLLDSKDPHGMTIGVGINYGAFDTFTNWAWSTGSNAIAPNGIIQMPLTQLLTYDGRLVESFQVQLTDSFDATNTVSGQGPNLLGLTVSYGQYKGPHKFPPGLTQ